MNLGIESASTLILRPIQVAISKVRHNYRRVAEGGLIVVNDDGLRRRSLSEPVRVHLLNTCGASALITNKWTVWHVLIPLILVNAAVVSKSQSE